MAVLKEMNDSLRLAMSHTVPEGCTLHSRKLRAWKMSGLVMPGAEAVELAGPSWVT